MDNKDLTLIIYDHIDSKKYQVDCVPQNDEYKQKVVFSIPELEMFLEEELSPTDRICFFIHAMTDSGIVTTIGTGFIQNEKFSFQSKWRPTTGMHGTDWGENSQRMFS